MGIFRGMFPNKKVPSVRLSDKSSSFSLSDISVQAAHANSKGGFEELLLYRADFPGLSEGYEAIGDFYRDSGLNMDSLSMYQQALIQKDPNTQALNGKIDQIRDQRNILLRLVSKEVGHEIESNMQIFLSSLKSLLAHR